MPVSLTGIALRATRGDYVTEPKPSQHLCGGGSVGYGCGGQGRRACSPKLKFTEVGSRSAKSQEGREDAATFTAVGHYQLCQLMRLIWLVMSWYKLVEHPFPRSLEQCHRHEWSIPMTLAWQASASRWSCRSGVSKSATKWLRVIDRTSTPSHGQTSRTIRAGPDLV